MAPFIYLFSSELILVKYCFNCIIKQINIIIRVNGFCYFIIQIEGLVADENAAVRKHARIAADVIKWKPWDLEVKCRGEKLEEKQCTCKN